ncbi:ChrR family anti-sigma-E factor [Microbaculum marinisediminis]|uniref:ChrR family anti-sigma-E factor n=1 Tax=Microbaculum marinisediminis TaxID=2931392 RepID=A0AAW5QZ41_9HYPH|nr:ChrR family anti-sigma-E factor [Microbaculum sp. A6E488]MCT8973326.1 ChrR family anti-sigma-E factor [Microbaculum sp. A6E488]
MSIHHHLDDATIMAYAAGTLREALCVAVAAHVAICPRCRAAVRAAEAAGGALLEEIDAVSLDADALDRAMARIETPAAARPAMPEPAPRPRDPRVPAPLARLIGGGLDEVRWRWLAPGVRSYEIPVTPGAGSLRLLRIAPGKAVPEHGHGGTELTLILSGSYSDVTGHYGPGDVADLDEDVEHAPVVDSPEDCICLVATESPTRFKGLIGRLLQPYFRI